MKSVIVHLKLPEDLSAKVLELAGDGSTKDCIVEALRNHWFPAKVEPENLDFDILHHGKEPSDPIYQVWGSIPAEQKRNA
jgi:hypothetical protein